MCSLDGDAMGVYTEERPKTTPLAVGSSPPRRRQPLPFAHSEEPHGTAPSEIADAPKRLDARILGWAPAERRRHGVRVRRVRLVERTRLAQRRWATAQVPLAQVAERRGRRELQRIGNSLNREARHLRQVA